MTPHPQPLLDPALRGATTLRRLAWLCRPPPGACGRPPRPRRPAPYSQRSGRRGASASPSTPCSSPRCGARPAGPAGGDRRQPALGDDLPAALPRGAGRRAVGRCGRWSTPPHPAAGAPPLPARPEAGLTRWHNTAAHKTGLTYVETDDAGSLFRFNDGFFLYAFFLGHHAADLRPAFEPAHPDTRARRWTGWSSSGSAFSGRAHGGGREVAKVFSLGAHSAPAFQARFPDARMLYMARDPLHHPQRPVAGDRGPRRGLRLLVAPGGPPAALPRPPVRRPRDAPRPLHRRLAGRPHRPEPGAAGPLPPAHAGLRRAHGGAPRLRGAPRGRRSPTR